MPSGDYSAEFKQRFADGCADGAAIAMLQHEFGLAKSTVKRGSTRAASGPWTGRGGTAAIPRDFKLRVVEAYPLGEGDCRALALEHGVRNGAQTRDRAKRRREGGDDAPVVHPPGRRRREPAGEEALDRRCESESESESTPIPLTPFTPPSGGLRLWASWPLRTRRG